MSAVAGSLVRQQLVLRRHRLEHAVHESPRPDLRLLLEEVDAALGRMNDGSWGICEYCHDPIEAERLIADPLVRFCIDHLSPREKTALEEDLQLAARIQKGLLPRPDLVCGAWRVSYHYAPAGVVSGDYCDVMDAGDGGLYFMLGDVSGKGVAASMLMAHLHAMFRALVSVGLPLKCMVERASRVFCESTLPTHYATLVSGRTQPNGDVEICNAGHLAPLVVRNGEVMTVEANGLPVGMFCNEEFTVSELFLEPGEGIVLFTDGVSEATGETGNEYGMERLRNVIARNPGLPPAALIAACRDDLTAFRNGTQAADDTTLLALQRLAS